jgi:hypothetical protein
LFREHCAAIKTTSYGTTGFRSTRLKAGYVPNPTGAGLPDLHCQVFFTAKPSLVEHCPAGLAKAGLLPPQAGGNRPHIRDFAGAQAIDVGRAGPALFGRCKVGPRRA